MTNQKTITCNFCQGTGKNPHFTGNCPVCKGKGKNQITGKYMECKDCHGSGQKKGTSLTCYTCGGLGLAPDTTKIFKKAAKEIEEAREEIAKERGEFNKKTKSASPLPEAGNPGEGELFCQCCGRKVRNSSTVKVCLKCVQKVKIKE